MELTSSLAEQAQPETRVSKAGHRICILTEDSQLRDLIESLLSEEGLLSASGLVSREDLLSEEDFVSKEDLVSEKRLLSEEGLLADSPCDLTVGVSLSSSTDVLLYAGAVTRELVHEVKAMQRKCSGLRVVVISRDGQASAMHLLGQGVDGLLHEQDLERTLAPTLRAVLAGQTVAPGGRSSELIPPALVLSPRERQILALVALGLANGQIAERLFLAKSTVKSHLTSAFSKLGVRSRGEAAALALDRETALGRNLAVTIERERMSGGRPRPSSVQALPSAVPFVDLERQHALIAEDLRSAFTRVVAASAFTLGEEVEQFEAEFAAYCETNHCVGVASGTAALTIALAAAGVGPGDEVIVPAHTFIASALSVLNAGATPVLCDVHDSTGLISVDSASPVVSERTVGVIAVHLYGQMCDMAAVQSFAERHRLMVFEDAAQAHGATFDSRRAGSFGTAGAFSFYPSKNLGALGDGGAICTSDPGIAERARMLRNLGQKQKGEHLIIASNERLDGLQAALLRAKLPHLDRWNAARLKWAERYRRELHDVVGMAHCNPLATAVHHVFPIRAHARDELAKQLRQMGVYTGVHYDRALHQHLALASLPGLPATGELPVAERWAREELSLPMFPEMEPDEVNRVIETCLEVMEDDGEPR